MKLSEAIRLGAMVTRPLVGDCLSPDNAAACALGAAYLAVGQGYSNFDSSVVAQQLPLLDEIQQMRCPLCGKPPEWGHGTIPHLNDDHGLTREQIAEWVETIERAQAPHDPTCDSSCVRTERPEPKAAEEGAPV